MSRCVVFILITLVVTVLCAEDPNQKYITVTTESGEIRGISEITLLDQRVFYAFKGIPYAKSPTDQLRFRAPEKVDPWIGVLNATEYGNICLQTTSDLTDFYGDEDCLTLNVFTPNATSINKVPVIFYIHGGGFMSGGAHIQGPDILLDEDVILVTLNYRLGPFGFLNLNTPEYSGNMGLKDQLMALKWVNNNIAHFGGDASRITIYGHSAGSISVNYHTISPASQGLFRRAIASSGSVSNSFSYNSRNHTKMLLDLMGQESKLQSEGASLYDIIGWVRNVDGKFLGLSTLIPVFVGGKRSKSISLTWLPVIEDTKSYQPFMTKKPSKYFNEPSDIDSLFGYMSSEDIIIAPTDINNPNELQPFDEHFEIDLPLAGLNFTFDSDAYKMYKKEIREYYFGNRSVNADTLPEYINLLDDIFFIYGIDKTVKAQAQRSSGRTYYFQFSAELDLNFFRLAANASRLGLKGATHCEDMIYLFNCQDWVPKSIYDGLKLDSDVGRMIQTLRTFIVNFVKFGNPAPNNQHVKPIENNITNFVDIQNGGLIPGINPHEDAISFWDNFFARHSELL